MMKTKRLTASERKGRLRVTLARKRLLARKRRAVHSVAQNGAKTGRPAAEALDTVAKPEAVPPTPDWAARLKGLGLYQKSHALIVGMAHDKLSQEDRTAILGLLEDGGSYAYTISTIHEIISLEAEVMGERVEKMLVYALYRLLGGAYGGMARAGLQGWDAWDAKGELPTGAGMLFQIMDRTRGRAMAGVDTAHLKEVLDEAQDLYSQYLGILQVSREVATVTGGEPPNAGRLKALEDNIQGAGNTYMINAAATRAMQAELEETPYRVPLDAPMPGRDWVGIEPDAEALEFYRQRVMGHVLRPDPGPWRFWENGSEPYPRRLDKWVGSPYGQ
jgi:hypothetical protein